MDMYSMVFNYGQRLGDPRKVDILLSSFGMKGRDKLDREIKDMKVRDYLGIRDKALEEVKALREKDQKEQGL